MTLITTTPDLQAFCAQLEGAPYIAIDTEFIRERTYWAQLCLVQIAGPQGAAAIDPLAKGIDLEPLFALMASQSVLKVFHAARQDVEIFFNHTQRIPTPLFDTQIAAMVCGFGENVAYETLAAKLAGARIDKSSRFTDWAHRPLSERQLSYALSDVIHLRPVYEKLMKRLQKSGRAHWLDEEMATLTDPDTYTLDPMDAYKRLKVRSHKPRFLAILREVAAWREREAQRRDLHRNRIIRDEALLEIAAHAPATAAELARTRGLGRGLAEGSQGAELLAAIGRGQALPEEACPTVAPHTDPPPGIAPIVELLRVLLKMKAEDNGVASRLIARADDLEAIAADDEAAVGALKGWRRELFGEDALALKHGRLALAIAGRRVRLVPIGAPAVAG